MRSILVLVLILVLEGLTRVLVLVLVGLVLVLVPVLGVQSLLTSLVAGPPFRSNGPYSVSATVTPLP